MDLMSGSVGNIRNMSEHISNELDEDVEPLMVSRGDVDEIVMPSYEDSLGGKCLLCKKNRVHSTISKLVNHVHYR